MDSIIFDLDGTLWDVTEKVALSWNRAVKENSSLDMHITKETLAAVFGKTMKEISDILFPSLSPDDKKKLIDICYVYENSMLETEPGQLYPHVFETLKTLSRTYPLYIVSNCQCGYIEIMAKTTGLASLIKDSLCYGQTLKEKHETIRMLAEKNNLVSPVYVGDTAGDRLACEKASVPFIHAAYGFGKDVICAHAIDDIRRLPDILETMKKEGL